VAFIAYYFHWGHDEILDMPHWERKRWCEEISRINEEMNTSGSPDLEPDARVDDVPVVDLDEQGDLFEDDE